ncbi:MAG: MBL fold metallo-hydrolase [Pseudomonadota bacterium]
MRLTILGSGSPEATARRAASGYLIEVAGTRILFDCGGGVVDRLLRAGLRPSDVDVLFLSHLHADHMMDYARLVHAAWDEGARPLAVYGPAPTAEMSEKLFGADGVFAPDLRARTELAPSQAVWVARGGTLPRPWPAPKVEEIAPGAQIVREGWRVSTLEVPHAQPLLTCLAFVIEADGLKVVYSGDAGRSPALAQACVGADLLVHWCYRLDGEVVSDEMAALTPTPTDIASMAQAAGVRRLVLTHFRAHMDTLAGHAAALSAMDAVFTGPCGIAEDLDQYVIAKGA